MEESSKCFINNIIENNWQQIWWPDIDDQVIEKANPEPLKRLSTQKL